MIEYECMNCGYIWEQLLTGHPRCPKCVSNDVGERCEHSFVDNNNDGYESCRFCGFVPSELEE